MSGLNNAPNGADRIVNGVAIQTKYFAAARDTLQSAFDTSTGLYRYSGQILEVPQDQHDACLAFLRTKISQGKVPQFLNPDDAGTILKRGSVTYRRARNIARADNLDSLSCDAASQLSITGVDRQERGEFCSGRAWRGPDGVDASLASAARGR